jgi:phosphate starvation-inducible PhoH-like protein
LRKTRKKKVIDATNDIGPNVNNIQAVANRTKVKPRSENQAKYIKAINEHDITFCQGLAGTGKTTIAVAMALEYLLEDKVKRIIITRPVVESGGSIGYIPGDISAKLNPYLLPILDEINNYVPMSTYINLTENRKIEIVPFGFMRGRNFNNCFIIADECQNASYDQLKMLLTRIGRESKMVLTGDINQSDLPHYHRGGFKYMMDSLYGINGIAISKLETSDIVRHPIIGKILERLEDLEEKTARESQK